MAAKDESEPKALNIHQRLLAVMKDVSYIQKGGKAPDKAGGYKYVKHDQVVAKIRPALIEHGVAVEPTTKTHEYEVFNEERGRTIYTRVCVETKFINVDNPGDFVSVEYWGYGLDRQDKSIGKAVSYAVKYALLKVLNLETGDDPEMDSNDVPASAPTSTGSTKPANSNGGSAPAGKDAEAFAAWKDCVAIVERWKYDEAKLLALCKDAHDDWTSWEAIPPTAIQAMKRSLEEKDVLRNELAELCKPLDSTPRAEIEKFRKGQNGKWENFLGLPLKDLETLVAELRTAARESEVA